MGGQDPFDVYQPILVPGVALTVTFSIAGIFGSANIVWATCRTRNLQNICNVLIALSALGDIFHQCSLLLFAYYYQSKHPFETVKRCFKLNLMSSFGMHFGCAAMLSLSLDRLYCIVAPVCYSKKNKRLYFLITMVFPVTYSVYLLYITYINVVKNPERKVVCMISQVFIDDAEDLWSTIRLLLFITLLLIYVFIWVFAYFRFKNFRSINKTFKVLSVVTLSILFGWFAASLVKYITLQSFLHPSMESVFIIHMDVGWLIHAGITANYFIYFTFSKTYRTAFIEQLHMLSCHLLHSSRTSSDIVININEPQVHVS